MKKAKYNSISMKKFSDGFKAIPVMIKVKDFGSKAKRFSSKAKDMKIGSGGSSRPRSCFENFITGEFRL